jgi:hypothetical protein
MIVLFCLHALFLQNHFLFYIIQSLFFVFVSTLAPAGGMKSGSGADGTQGSKFNSI